MGAEAKNFCLGKGSAVELANLSVHREGILETSLGTVSSRHIHLFREYLLHTYCILVVLITGNTVVSNADRSHLGEEDQGSRQTYSGCSVF